MENNQPKTEIHRAVEKKLSENNLKSFLTKTHNFIIKYFDLETEWGCVMDSLSIKKYKTSTDRTDFDLKAGDEVTVVLDMDSNTVIFMTDSFETLMVISFTKPTPELSINEDIDMKYQNIMMLLTENIRNAFSVK